MPTGYGAEFRQDVIDVALNGKALLAQMAKDFGLSVTALKGWIAIAERYDPGPPGSGRVGRDAGDEEAEPVVGAGERDPAPGSCQSCQEHQPRMIYPMVTDLAADGVPMAVTCRVLEFSMQGYCRWRVSLVNERDQIDAH